MQLPDTFWPALTMIGGFAMFLLGLSFAWKCVNAAFYGKVAYWSGLQGFGILFAPITVFLSPLVIHLPYDLKKGLIRERQQLWVHLFFGPVFFVLSLMCMTSGADLMGLPGSSSLNCVLTLNRSDIPPCIVYSPPFHYRFPFLKKAAKSVYKAVTYVIPTDKKDSYNAFERNGEDVSKYSGNPTWFDDDVDEAPRAAPPAASTTTAPKRHR